MLLPTLVSAEGLVVRSFNGDYSYQEGGGGRFSRGHVGQELSLGTVIESGSGYLLLSIAEEMRLLLSPETRIEIRSVAPRQEGLAVELRLFRGDMKVYVATATSTGSVIDIETENAIVGTRGGQDGGVAVISFDQERNETSLFAVAGRGYLRGRGITLKEAAGLSFDEGHMTLIKGNGSASDPGPYDAATAPLGAIDITEEDVELPLPEGGQWGMSPMAYLALGVLVLGIAFGVRRAVKS